MKQLLITANKQGKISHVPNKNTFGRRETVAIQMVRQNVKPLIPCSTPIAFIPPVNTGLSDRLDYIQAELLKVQVQRRQEEFSHFAHYSDLNDEEAEPFMQLPEDLYHDRDVELIESAIPFHLQEKGSGSLNDRQKNNKHPHDTVRCVVIDESKPKKKMTYSRWSE
jgi:hypothetical protein